MDGTRIALEQHEGEVAHPSAADAVVDAVIGRGRSGGRPPASGTGSSPGGAPARRRRPRRIEMLAWRPSKKSPPGPSAPRNRASLHSVSRPPTWPSDR